MSKKLFSSHGITCCTNLCAVSELSAKLPFSTCLLMEKPRSTSEFPWERIRTIFTILYTSLNSGLSSTSVLCIEVIKRIFYIFGTGLAESFALLLSSSDETNLPQDLKALFAVAVEIGLALIKPSQRCLKLSEFTFGVVQITDGLNEILLFVMLYFKGERF